MLVLIMILSFVIIFGDEDDGGVYADGDGDVDAVMLMVIVMVAVAAAADGAATATATVIATATATASAAATATAFAAATKTTRIGSMQFSQEHKVFTHDRTTRGQRRPENEARSHWRA